MKGRDCLLISSVSTDLVTSHGCAANYPLDSVHLGFGRCTSQTCRAYLETLSQNMKEIYGTKFPELGEIAPPIFEY
jgi:hypothetical protein